jgi:hypothetical protein
LACPETGRSNEVDVDERLLLDPGMPQDRPRSFEVDIRTSPALGGQRQCVRDVSVLLSMAAGVRLIRSYDQSGCETKATLDLA